MQRPLGSRPALAHRHPCPPLAAMSSDSPIGAEYDAGLIPLKQNPTIPPLGQRSGPRKYFNRTTSAHLFHFIFIYSFIYVQRERPLGRGIAGSIRGGRQSRDPLDERVSSLNTPFALDTTHPLVNPDFRCRAENPSFRLRAPALTSMDSPRRGTGDGRLTFGLSPK